MDIRAGKVVSSAGIYNTFQRMLPEAAARRSPLYNLHDRVRPSYGVMCVFVGLRASARDLGLTGDNI